MMHTWFECKIRYEKVMENGIHTWMLPVVDKQNRYMGFISKSRILNAYREQLVKIQQ